MADLNKEFDELLKKMRNLGASGKELSSMKALFDNMSKSGEDVNDVLLVMEQRIQRMSGATEDLTVSFKDQNTIIKANTKALADKNIVINQAAALQRKVQNIQDDMYSDAVGTLDLSKKQLEQKKKDLEVVNDRQAALRADAASEAKELEDRQKAGETLSKAEQKRLERLKDIADFRAEEDLGTKSLIKTIEKRLEQEKEINRLMGLSGAIVNTLQSGMKNLGIESGFITDAIEESNTAMRDMAREIAINGKKGGTLTVLMAGLGPLAKGFGRALMDPAAIIGMIVKKFGELDKLNTNFVRLTGQNVSYANAISTRFASAADIMEMMVEFTAETGLNAQAIFSEDDLARMAEAKNLLGLTNKEAAQLGTLSKVSGMNIEQSKEAIVAATNEFNAQNDAAVAHGVVLKDVLNTSDGIALSFGGSTQAIAGAASAARSLGMNLAQVDRIADSLMNFESSIEKELEAQLLTGNRINMSKARELALNNDLEGLSKELAANGASAAEFANMNRIQQQALAEALGMSKDELAKMLIAQEQQGDLTDEQRAKMRGVTVEQLQQMEASESLKKAFSKLAEPIAKILTALTPIVNVIARIISAVAPVAGFLLPILAVAKALGGSFLTIGGNIGSATKAAKTFGKGLLSAVKSPGETFKKLKDGIKGMGGLLKKGFDTGMGDKAGSIIKDARLPSGFRDAKTGKAVSKKAGEAFFGAKDKAKDVADGMKQTSDAAKSSQNLGPSLGEKIADFFKGLATGLKEMASTKVLQGAGSALVASPALIALGVASPGLYILGKVNGAGIGASLTGIATGLKSFASNKVLQGALYLIPAALGFTAMTAGAVGIAALALGGAAAGAGLIGLGGGLVVFGKAMATNTPLGPVGLVAPIALGLLTASLIPLGYALNLAAPALEAIGTIISSVFSGIATVVTAVAQGFTLMFGAVAENIGAFLLLGPALLGIGAGLSVIAMSGIGALPVLGALAALAVVSGPLAALGTSMFGGGGDEGGDDKVAEKLDKILSAIEKGGDVYLDGTKVGEALTLGSYKL